MGTGVVRPKGQRPCWRGRSPGRSVTGTPDTGKWRGPRRGRTVPAGNGGRWPSNHPIENREEPVFWRSPPRPRSASPPSSVLNPLPHHTGRRAVLAAPGVLAQQLQDLFPLAPRRRLHPLGCPLVLQHCRQLARLPPHQNPAGQAQQVTFLGLISIKGVGR